MELMFAFPGADYSAQKGAAIYGYSTTLSAGNVLDHSGADREERGDRDRLVREGIRLRAEVRDARARWQDHARPTDLPGPLDHAHPGRRLRLPVTSSGQQWREARGGPVRLLRGRGRALRPRQSRRREDRIRAAGPVLGRPHLQYDRPGRLLL